MIACNYFKDFDFVGFSDQLAKNIIVKENVSDITIGMVRELWTSVGWVDGSILQPDRLLDALNNSSSVYLAWHSGKLVGLLSVVSDGFNAIISWLAVKSEYQGRGVGTKLMNHFINNYSDYRWYVHTTKANGFYEKFGFEEVSHGMSRTKL